MWKARAPISTQALASRASSAAETGTARWSSLVSAPLRVACSSTAAYPRAGGADRHASAPAPSSPSPPEDNAAPAPRGRSSAPDPCRHSSDRASGRCSASGSPSSRDGPTGGPLGAARRVSAARRWLSYQHLSSPSLAPTATLKKPRSQQERLSAIMGVLRAPRRALHAHSREVLPQKGQGLRLLVRGLRHHAERAESGVRWRHRGPHGGTSRNF